MELKSKTNQALVIELHNVVESLIDNAVNSLQWGDKLDLNINDFIQLRALANQFATRFVVNKEG